MILVVADQQMIGDLLRDALIRRGHRVCCTTSGREAIHLFLHHRPSVTLLDLNLDDLDGLSVLTELRAMDPHAAVIMMSDVATDDLENHARELGAVAFLRTGLSLHVMTHAVERELMRRRGSQVPIPSGNAPLSQSFDHAAILVVDDEPAVCGLIGTALTRAGYRVVLALTSHDALTFVEHDPPQLAILDVYLPVMDGVELLRTLRARGYAGGVIMLTASQDESALRDAMDMGAIDVLAKPVDLDRLLLLVQAGLILSEPPVRHAHSA